MVSASDSRSRGRKRDPNIDARILEVATRHLSDRGFEAVSLAAIAEEAGTTRQALYRRWPSKEALLGDVIRSGADNACAIAADDPRRALELELADFEQAMNRRGAISIVGTMLQESTPHEARECYRDNVLEPRQRRLRDILGRARESGQIDASADLDVAISFATGAWYARALAGDSAPADWASRTAALLWRAVGGS
jgi:AcrR family transcriptional regulator